MKIAPFAIRLVFSSLAASVEWRVDPVAGAGGDGSLERPFSALPFAVKTLPAAPPGPLTLVLASGVHLITEPIILGAAKLHGRSLDAARTPAPLRGASRQTAATSRLWLGSRRWRDVIG